MLLCLCVVIYLFASLVSANPIMESDCAFHYLTQPIQHFTCNPFHERNPAIGLECNVHGPIDSNFEIQWYANLGRRLDEGSFQLTRELSNVIIYEGAQQFRSFRRSTLLIVRPNELYVGTYWCQIVADSGDGTKQFLQPSQKTIVKPQEDYAHLLPCPFSPLDELNVKCAEAELPPVTPTSDDEPPSPDLTTANLPLPSSVVLLDPATNLNSTESVQFPIWGYALLTVGAAIIVIVLTAVIAVAVIFHRKTHIKRRYGPAVHIEIQTEEADTTTRRTRPPPLVPHRNGLPNRQQSLPHHLSVARQQSNNSVYTEIDEPLRECSNSLQEECVEQGSTLTANTHENGTDPLYATKSPPKLVMRGRHLYHVIDPEKRGTQPPTYTTLSPSHAQNNARTMPKWRKPIQPRPLELEQTGYYNDKMYQPLSPETREYVSLYSSTAENQKQDSSL